MSEVKNPKIMPNNIEAEQSLLGSILIDDMVATEVLSELNVNDFYYQSHKLMFEAMQELQREGKPIDIITLSDKLVKSKSSDKSGKVVTTDNLQKVGGMAYLTELTNAIPSSANFRYYFDIVKKNGMLRKIIGASNRISENTYGADDANRALAYAEKTIFELSDEQDNKDLVHVNDTINTVLQGYEKVLIDPDCNKGQLSYFKNLDKFTNGYKGGQMIILAARPGCGKTSFAMNMVCNIAKNEPDKVVAVFNLEMSISELTQRILLTMASVPHESVINGASADEFKRLWQAKKILEQSNVYIDDTANTTPEQIMSKCRRLKQMKKRLDFVVIDYLQLLKAQNSRQSIQQEVTEISRSIKIMAKELDVPVLALSQTSRDLEKRDDGDPKMSDLRESGAIEQDADQVYFLVKQKNSEGDIQVIDLHIVKHRSGSTGKISFKWEGSMVKFTPLSFEEARNMKQAKSTVEEAIAKGQSANAEGSANTNVNPTEEVERISVEDLTPPPADNSFASEFIPPAESGSGEPDWGAEFDNITSSK
ncbi:MAG: replicative DNA helicase, partial [Clostridia bacterium]|nr:replicative DNA helicase [Clostridia bacterium]